MTDITPLIPRQPVPPLAVPLVDGGRFNIADERPDRFTFVVFYRGLHCPICRTQLIDLEAKLPEFGKRGVSVAALSSDMPSAQNAPSRSGSCRNCASAMGSSLRPLARGVSISLRDAG